MATARLELNIETPDDLAMILEDILTFRQLRRLAKRNKIHQYSYHDKHGLAICLAYQAHNKAKRHHNAVDL